MTKLNIIALWALVFSIWSCTDEEYVKPAPQLGITVVSRYLTPVPEASVTLYNTKDDLITQVNPIIKLKTDASGQVTFENLEEQRYYFFACKDELDNSCDVAATRNELESGQRIEVVVKVATPINY